MANSIAYNPLNTLKQFVGILPMNCLSMFYHFIGLVLIELSMCDLLVNTGHERVNYRIYNLFLGTERLIIILLIMLYRHLTFDMCIGNISRR